MATITFKGTNVEITGELPSVGSQAPAFELVGPDLGVRTLESYKGKKKVLNIFPSIDTPVCASSVRAFNERAGARDDTVVVNVSADLPFAAKRFCGAEGLTGVESGSTFRGSFETDYGVEMGSGLLIGLCARAVVVIDANDTVVHTELVPDIAQEPDYDAAFAALDATTATA